MRLKSWHSLGPTGRVLLCATAVAWLSAAKAQAETSADSRTASDSVPACDGEPQDCFLALGFTIDGASAIAPDTFLPFYEPYLGRPIGSRDLTVIAQRITDRYRASGYFLSRAVVPPQDGGGIGRIVVIEGKISEIAIEGNGAGQAAPYFRGLDREHVADIHDLDRRIALAGDVPGLAVRARLEPIADDPHRHRLIITATFTHGELRASLDNRGPQAAGPWEAYAHVAANTLVRQGDQAGLGLFTTPIDPREFTALDGSYAATSSDGGRAQISATLSHSRTISSDVTPDSGNSAALGLSYEFPLLRGRGAGVWLGAAFDLRQQREDDTFIDELRIARFGLRGFLDDGGHATTAFAQTSIGLPILGASDSSPRRSRANADATFTSFLFFGSHYSAIGDHFGIYGAIAGQWSSSRLLVEEQFAAGGPPFGRAYAYGEILGDDALAAELEVRAGLRPDRSLLTYVEAYLFTDGARVWRLGEDSADLASVGAGVRFNLHDGIAAGWEVAHGWAGAAARNDDWRQFFSISTLTRY